MILIASKAHLGSLTCFNEITFFSGEEAAAHWSEIEERLTAGESMVFASPDYLHLLEPLWITHIPGKMIGNAVSKNCPANIPNLSVKSAFGYVGVCPPSHYALHGVHEEPRMDMYPFLIDTDCFGAERGTVGLLLKHYDKSLTHSRFQGSCWYVLSAELTSESLDALCWSAIKYSRSQCMIMRLKPEFPLYYENERVHLRCQLWNASEEIQSGQLQLTATWENHSVTIGIRELMLNANDTHEVEIDWYPSNVPSDGLCKLQVKLELTDRKLYGFKRDASLRTVDVLEEKVYFLKDRERKRPIVDLTASAFIIDGESGFWIGTHYYPCTDFYELSYRPLRTAMAEQEIIRMAKTGVRICRIWCDPILEESSIRGMETLLELFADNGIIAIVTFFTSWARWLEVCTVDHQCRFEAVDMIDESYVGLTMRNMEQQKVYVAALAHRWKHITNLIWDFTNEFSVVKDSPQTGIDEFQNWARSLKATLRETGAQQPVIFGTSCWDTGSENYRCNDGGDIVPDHNYQSIGAVEYLPFYQNSVCREQPFFTEEFGGVWTDAAERSREYHYRYHVFLAAGNAAAVNYEWGVTWLADSLSGMPAYLKFQNEAPMNELKGFFLEGRDSYSKTWPKGTAGLCPWIASPEYGCIVTAANHLTPTLLVMKRLAQIGKDLEYKPEQKETYFLLPFETKPLMQGAGYQRLTGRMNQWLDTLWEQGADFEIWQEDCIDKLPASATNVLYPNEMPIDAELEKVFSRLEARGVSVHRDGSENWTNTISVCSLQPKEQRRLLKRTIPNGVLQILLNDGERRVFDCGKFSLEADQSGLWADKNGKIVLVGFSGVFTYGELSVKTEGMTYIRSCDDSDLSCASVLEVLPVECGKLWLPDHVKSVKLYDGNRTLEILDFDKSLEITQEYLPYSLLIQREIET